MDDRILFPSVSRIQNDNKTARSFYLRTISFMSIIMSYVGIVFYFYSKELILILLGDKWLDLIVIFKIFSIIIPFRLICRLSDAIIRAKGAVYRSSLIKFIYAILVIISTYIGVGWGLEGISILICISVFVHFLLLANLSLKLLQGTWIIFAKAFLPALKF